MRTIPSMPQAEYQAALRFVFSPPIQQLMQATASEAHTHQGVPLAPILAGLRRHSDENPKLQEAVTFIDEVFGPDESDLNSPWAVHVASALTHLKLSPLMYQHFSYALSQAVQDAAVYLEHAPGRTPR